MLHAGACQLQQCLLLTAYALPIQVKPLQLECSPESINLLHVELRGELVRWWAAAVAGQEGVATPHLQEATREVEALLAAAAAAALLLLPCHCYCPSS